MADVLQLVMGGQLIAFFALRLAHEPAADKKVDLKEHGLFRVSMTLLAVCQVGILLGLVLNPIAFAFADINLPIAIRWFGAGFGVLVLGGLAWTYQSLGDSYHSILHLDNDQKLVTDGPYRLVRHPLYTGLFLIFFAFFVQASNWLVLVFGIGGLSVLLLVRVPKEEALLVSHFGNTYRVYMNQTNRFFP